jgi:hypothetical protein
VKLVILLSSIFVSVGPVVMEEIFLLTTAQLWFLLLMEIVDWNLMEEMTRIQLHLKKSKYTGYLVDVSSIP